MNIEEIEDGAIQEAAADMAARIQEVVTGAAARATANGDHEVASTLKEAAEKLTGVMPVEPETSGVAPEVSQVPDLTGFKVPPPQQVVVMSGSTGLSVRKFGRKVAEGAGGALLAYEVGTRLPDGTNPYVRIGATVVAAAVGATVVGAAIDAASRWIGTDTA